MKQSTHAPSFFRSVAALAVPVALQSMLQASFSVVDQIMIGQLDSISVAGVGIAGKFSSIFSVIASALGAVAGIMISQHLGQKKLTEVRRSFYVNLFPALLIALFFTVPCLLFPERIMRLYSADPAAVAVASEYLRVIAWSFFPIAISTMLSALLRCVDRPRLPLYAGIASALLNTGMNELLIFGRLGLPALGARGAAIATLLSQLVNCLVLLALYPRRSTPLFRSDKAPLGRFALREYLAMLLPILVCEVLWSLGENVYAAIYGNMSTESSAAMTLINPVQGLVIGALCGLSQAAGVIVGKLLGAEDFDGAYRASGKLLLYGVVGSGIFSMLVLLTSPFYAQIYRVEQSVRTLTGQILIAYALVAPLKVLNMILGSGILRSGGKTKYVMLIDIIGTWGFGVPIGLLSAFVCHLPIACVYFLLSLEEGVRLILSLAVFRRKRWMNRLGDDTPQEILTTQK